MEFKKEVDIKSGLEYLARPGLDLHQHIMLDILKSFSEICMNNRIDFWIDGGTLLGMSRHDSLIPWDDDIDICVPMYDWDKLISKLTDLSQKDERYSLFYKSNRLNSWCEYFGRKDYLYEDDEGFLRPVKIDLFPVKFISKDNLDYDIDMVDQVSQYLKYNKLGPEIKIPLNFSSALKYKNETIEKYYNYCRSNSVAKENHFAIKGHGQFSPIKKADVHIIYPLKTDSFMGIEVNVPNNVDKYLRLTYGEDYFCPPDIGKRKSYNINTFEVDKISLSEYYIRCSSGYENILFYLQKYRLVQVYKLFILFKSRGVYFTVKKIFNFLKRG
ncbi:LicD family protein [Vibrio cholerae]|nr:LicD family protein [Vibrio cholerae]